MAESTDINESSSAPLARSESSTAHQFRRTNKRKKRIAYIVVFALLLIILVLVFALIVLRFETPKFRVRAASFAAFEVGKNSTNPSFNFLVNAQFTVKNTNFGKFEYEYGTVGFEYRGLNLGHANMDDARVRAKTTKRVNASVALNSKGLGSELSEELGSDIGGGVLGLRSYSMLEGEIKVMKVFKKNKYARLNCTMDVQISTQTINNINCI